MWNVHYNIFGKIDKISKNEIDNPIRMQGQYEDEETGLYYNRYRYYDPNISAYVSQDPLGLGAGENVYSYTLNSFGWIDPLGLVGWNYNTMPSINGFQKHHIIPQQFADHDVLKKAGMNIHEQKNIIYLPTDEKNHPTRTIHKGSHPGYNKDIGEKLDRISEIGEEKNWSEKEYKNAVKKVMKDSRQK